MPKANKFFTEVGPNLANKINPPRKLFHEYFKKYQTCQPENAISVNELKDWLFYLKINKSAGCDDISFNVVRPISVLSCFSKILERIMYNRLYKYLTDNNILYKKQFGFETGHSTKLTKLTATLKKISILYVSLLTFIRPLTLLIIKVWLPN